MAPRDTARAITLLGDGQPVSIQRAQAAGITRGQLRAAISAGLLSVPHRGVVLSTSLTAGDPASQYTTRVLGFARTHPETIFCSFTAAHLLRLPVPTIGAPRHLHVFGARSRRTGEVWRYNIPHSPDRDVIADANTGVWVTHPLITASQIATTYDLPRALVALEAAFRRAVLELVDDPHGVDHVAVRSVVAQERIQQVLHEIIDSWRHRTGIANLITAVSVASPLSESPAESFSHGQLVRSGYTVVQQVEVCDADGVHRRLDFLIDGCIAGEVDGLVKYEGDDGRRRLQADKRRDAALLAMGLPTVRWTPAEIRDSPHVVTNRIDTALGRIPRTAVFHRTG